MMLGVCILLAVVIPATGFYQWFIRGVSDAYGIVDAGDVSQLLNNINGLISGNRTCSSSRSGLR